MDATPSLLLVEDDPELGAAVEAGLRQDGFAVDWARSGTTAKTMLIDHRYQAVLLDLSLPGESGLSLLMRLRGQQDCAPVLIITARDAVAERVEGLNLGADDYIVKPFDLDELSARIRAVLRRRRGAIVSELRAGSLRLDVARRTVFVGDMGVSVSAQEFRTLLALMQRAGRVVSKRELEEAIYGWNAGIESNAVEVFVHQLRRKLGADLIQTVRGFGYRVG